MKRYIKTLAVGCILAVISIVIFKGWKHHMAPRNFGYLEAVYPVDNLAELFNHFPKGFTLDETLEVYDGEQRITILMDVQGNGLRKKITGEVTVKRIKDEVTEIIEKYPVQFLEGRLVVPEEKLTAKYLRDFKFLVTTLDYTASHFDRSKASFITDNPSWGRYGEDYVMDQSLGLLEQYGENPQSVQYHIEFLKPLEEERGQRDVLISVHLIQQEAKTSGIYRIAEHLKGTE